MRPNPTRELSAVSRFAAVVVVAAFAFAGCGSDSSDAASSATTTSESSGSTVGAEDSEPVTVRLVTHDSFAVSDGIFDSFTAETGITVEVVQGGDAGELVSRAVLSAGQPEGDVLFGIDNTFLQRGLDADLFDPYEAEALSSVPAELRLDAEHRVTPIDFGDVCVNYWIDALPGEAPATLDDLLEPANAASFVTENPETSSPGFAFLLATIATYGDGWEDYWQQLADGGVSVTAGWSEAYYGDFVAGGGDRAIVTSYASSPVAEVLFAEPAIDVAPTGVLLDSCFRQIEFAGVLNGAENPEAGGKLVDFLLSPTFQADIPLNMFVAPANGDVPLPDSFVEHGVIVEDPLTIDPAEIEANRLAWTDRWNQIITG